MKPNFIKQEDAMIVWNTNPDNINEMIELHVYKWSKEDRKNYYKDEWRKEPPYRHCRKSNGNCCSGWKELTKDQLVCRVLRILFNDKPKNDNFFKKCLL